MRRTTLKIPDSLDARLRHEAERRGTTISEVNREALEAYLLEPGERRRLGAAAAGHSGHSDVSERIEEILAARSPDSGFARRRRPSLCLRRRVWLPWRDVRQPSG